MQRSFANKQAFYDGNTSYDGWDMKKLNNDRNTAM